MADEVVEQVIEKLLEDPAFREDFARDRQGALKSFTLTAGQLAALLAVNLPLLAGIANRVGAWKTSVPKLI